MTKFFTINDYTTAQLVAALRRKIETADNDLFEQHQWDDIENAADVLENAAPAIDTNLGKQR